MKKSFKRILIVGVSLFIFNAFPIITHADPEPPCPGPDPITGECPIDSGLVILIAIGAAYGIKKVVDSRKATVIE